ncbi:hypothetical protein H4R33_002362 [Dimargaris cristalligena]|nr:hypothetical protein H4R33_002362 [Dimargaris cristalligena]
MKTGIQPRNADELTLPHHEYAGLESRFDILTPYQPLYPKVPADVDESRVPSVGYYPKPSQRFNRQYPRTLAKKSSPFKGELSPVESGIDTRRPAQNWSFDIPPTSGRHRGSQSDSEGNPEFRSESLYPTPYFGASPVDGEYPFTPSDSIPSYVSYTGSESGYSALYPQYPPYHHGSNIESDEYPSFSSIYPTVPPVMEDPQLSTMGPNGMYAKLDETPLSYDLHSKTSKDDKDFYLLSKRLEAITGRNSRGPERLVRTRGVPPNHIKFMR